MIKHNDDNIFVGEIKQLLKSFNLPKARVYKVNTPLVSGLHYIRDNNIFYCDENKNLEFVDTYVYNNYYGNLTTNLRVTSNVYDSYTHKYLGRYLRFLKDFKGLDLMSMYNCFSNEQVRNVTIVAGGETFSDKEPSFDVYCIPVRFGQKYTIGINSSYPINVTTCFYKSNKLVEVGESQNLYDRTFDVVRTCSLTKPYVYTKLDTYTPSEEEIKKEECLCLLVKVPSKCESSIVVLEGDFTKNTKVSYIDRNKLLNGLLKFKQSHQFWTEDEHSGDSYEQVDDFNTWFGKMDFTSKPELLSYLNSKGKNLLATRLIEYISSNAVTNISDDYDIKKLQKELMRRGYVSTDFLGIWSDLDREGLYKFINDFNINNDRYDVISYLDKDVEYRIGGID